MSKKIIFGICAVIILLTVSFFSGRASRTTGFTELEDRAASLESLIDDQARTIENITAGLRKSNNRVIELTIEAGRLKESNRKLTNQLGFITEGLSGDIKGIQRVIKRIDFYIPKTEEEN